MFVPVPPCGGLKNITRLRYKARLITVGLNVTFKNICGAEEVYYKEI